MKTTRSRARQFFRNDDEVFITEFDQHNSQKLLRSSFNILEALSSVDDNVSGWKHHQPGKKKFMPTLAFLSFELQVAQRCLRETFAESQMRVRKHSTGIDKDHWMIRRVQLLGYSALTTSRNARMVEARLSRFQTMAKPVVWDRPLIGR
jgi:hypothetical protein